MTSMDKTYQPNDIEHKWYSNWEERGYFKAKGSGNPYCIMIPPPNVTGSLHMGHGFQHTLMDVLTRYHRMLGDNTLWQVGTDHAGISTQLVVEKQLQADNKSRLDFERDEFVDKIWQWKQESGNRITQQIRRLGASVDWSRERFTLDDNLSDAVQTVFIDLYNEGLIYRGKRLVNWDPKLKTAISDLEVISEEEEGHLWHLRYPLADSQGHLTVATTRPETMLGDVAVAVHPEDERYRDLIGKQVMLPISNRPIPIIADDYVDPSFGSGCVKITPAHDFNDYALGQRHHLEQINILTSDACINENAPITYQGLDRFAAREKIIGELDQLNLLEKIEPHKHAIPRGEKSGAIIEPYLTDQWFVKIAPLAKPAIKAVETGEIKFIPENWNKTYFQWMNNIEDWCISRQLWWGHRIPAWYDQQGNIYVGTSEDEIRTKHQLSQSIALTQDNDVLDTWFSSALWPFATLDWPKNSEELKQFYPTNVLVTGFDIIFFWVARMIMMGLKFTGKIPFKEIYITGLIRDAEGQKMSKSKGNTLDPLDLTDGIEADALIKKRTQHLLLDKQKNKIIQQTKNEFPEGIPAYGTDALRFTYCALASTGRNIRFSMGRIEGYRNFCNKLWNAARYVMMITQEEESDWGDGPHQYSLADKWILSRLQHTIQQSHKYYDNYRFDLLANTLYEFFWHEYCDWYLEFSKVILYSATSSKALKRGARHALLTTSETTLRLLHPIIPFITEEIWQKISKYAGVTGPSIMLQPYPQVDESLIEDACEADINWVKEIILGIRNIRGEMNISPNKQLTAFFAKGLASDKKRLNQHGDLLRTLAKLESITWLEDGTKAPLAATALAGNMEILIPMAGIIDKKAEASRLSKEIDKLRKSLQFSDGKLTNPAFVNKAPEAVVIKEKQKVAELQSALSKLEMQLERVIAL